MERLVWAEGILLVVILLFMPLYAVWVSRKQALGTGPKLKGLGLPEGSIRGMLALMSVGSFVILLVLGPGAPEMKEFFDKALAAFGTLTGAVIGFYFGNRGTAAASIPEASTAPITPTATTVSTVTSGEVSAGPTSEAALAQSDDSAPATAKPE